ncbi:hypothetical protein [Daejeonella sp.]|jgi:hypothetical protein|uniref:hypothetical protein n=1 Tax=Daejeonella sp. TaxID=2805397 RepID=UPI0037BFAF8C
MKLSVSDSDLLGLVHLIRLYGKNLSKTWSYTITHLIRKIHDQEHFPVTDMVKKELNADSLNKYQRQKLNRRLENDSLMIEHMIAVQSIINVIMKFQYSKNDNDAIRELRSILEANTNCIIKFAIKEKDLKGI